jgi:hypothetical protein
MTMRPRSSFLVLPLVAAAMQAHAQQPSSIGTAAALGDAAVTESRRSDAILWNPALIGIYDGPMATYSVLATDIAAFPASSWRSPARALGLNGVPPVLRWAESAGGGAGAAVSAGRIQWFASQNRDFALSLASHHTSAGAIPGAISVPLGGAAGAGSPLSGDSSLRVSASVLSIGRGMHVGKLPGVGSVWVGAAAKGWLVHSYARGAFQAEEPGEEVYREVAVRNVPGLGLDVGMAIQPSQRVRVGVSVSNVVAGAFRPKAWPRVRTVSVVPTGPEAVEVTESEGPNVQPEDDGTEDARLAHALWETLNYPAVLRAGGSVETDLGSIAGAVRTTLTEGGLDPEWEASPYTLAYAGPGALPVNASYAWGGGTSAVSLGLRVGTCERRWYLAVVRRETPWGTTLGTSASLTLGSRSGCDVFRS